MSPYISLSQWCHPSSSEFGSSILVPHTHNKIESNISCFTVFQILKVFWWGLKPGTSRFKCNWSYNLTYLTKASKLLSPLCKLAVINCPPQVQKWHYPLERKRKKKSLVVKPDQLPSRMRAVERVQEEPHHTRSQLLPKQLLPDHPDLELRL